MAGSDLALALDSFSGRKLGKYEVLCRLSTGGMSEIFLAWQRGLAGFRKFVVLKQILPDIKGEEQFVRMFLEEAKITAAFTHPNIAQVYDLDIQDGELFLAMEFVPGATLVEVAKACYGNKEPIPIGFTLAVMRDTALALHYAHTFTDPAGRQQQIIHRDVAEKNIMVTYDGTAKLLDFGIAKRMGHAGRTTIGTVKGTSGYMSPEQILGKKLDARSDVFALGVVLHELLTGTRLFVGKSNEDELLAPMNEPVEPPSRQNPAVPPSLDAVVLKALQQRPEDRHATAKEFARAVEQACPGELWDAEQTGVLIRRLFRERRENTARLLEESEGQGDITGFTKVAQLLGADSITRPEILPPPPEDALPTPFTGTKAVAPSAASSPGPSPREGSRITAVMPTPAEGLVPVDPLIAAPGMPEPQLEDGTFRTSPERPKARMDRALQAVPDEADPEVDVTRPVVGPALTAAAPAAYPKTDERTDRGTVDLRPPLPPEPVTSGSGNNGEGPTVMDPRRQVRTAEPQPEGDAEAEPVERSGSTHLGTAPHALRSRARLFAFLAGFGVVLAGMLVALGLYLSHRDEPGGEALARVEPTTGPTAPQPEPLPPVAEPPAPSAKAEPQPPVADVAPKEQAASEPVERTRREEKEKEKDSRRRGSRERRGREELGSLTLVTDPYSRVFLGGKALGTTPLFKVALPVGRHTLRVVGPDNRPRKLPVEIGANVVTRYTVGLRVLALE